MRTLFSEFIFYFVRRRKLAHGQRGCEERLLRQLTSVAILFRIDCRHNLIEFS